MNHQAKASTTTGKRLGGLDKVIPGKVDMSKRGWLRACDAGLAPWGVKIGARRLWDLDEIDAWIAGGCKRVR
jgi:hypothetical protein